MFQAGNEYRNTNIEREKGMIKIPPGLNRMFWLLFHYTGSKARQVAREQKFDMMKFLNNYERSVIVGKAWKKVREHLNSIIVKI